MTDELASPLKLLTNAFTEIPFNRMLGLQLTSLDQTHAEMHFPMKGDLIGNYLHGILHGGVISSVLDMAGGIVVMTNALHHAIADAKTNYTDIVGRCSTIDLQVSFLRPGLGKEFTAKAWLLKDGKKITFMRMELWNDEKVLIATGNGTYTHP